MVCDSCLNVAYDNGFKTYVEQADVMKDMGDDLEDHLCDQVETEGEIECECGCRSYNSE